MTEGRPPTVGSAPLWERDAEIATVAQALDVLCADQSSGGSLLVLRGEAGLGKTALLAETRRIAERRGCTVWSARGAETLKSVPFHVVRQLLQPALLSLLPEEAREYLGDWYDIAGPALGIADPQGDKADPQYVCDGLVAAVRRLSRRQWPLVLLLDDAHWADQETLRWLAAFAERLDDLSVLVVVARLATMNDDLARSCADLLCTARILTEPEPVPGTERAAGELEFVHPLIATAVYNSIPPGVCTAMHGVAAQIITELGRGAAEAARHLLKVHPDDDEELVEQLRDAAREHLAVGAPDAARRCLERALQEPPRPEVHAHVLYELGCATLLTNPAVTTEHLQSALAMPGLDGDERVDAVVRLSQALLHNDQLEEAVRTVEAEAARHEAGPVRMRLQAFQFMWEGIHGETVSPARSRRLAELADTCTGRDNAERALLILRGFDAMTHGESADEVLQLCDRALVNGRLAPGLGWTDPEWGMELLMMLGSAYAYADRLDRAESLFAEARRVYTAAGWRGGHLSLANAFLGLAYRRQGRLRDAESTLREALVLAERVGRRLPLYWSATCGLVDTLLARGRVEEAWAVAEQYGFAPPYPSTIVLPDIRSVRGRLLLAVGRTEEGINELEAAEKTATSRGGHNPVLAPWSIDLAKALAGQDPERAAQLVADARRQAERFGTDTAIGEALRCAAALETGRRAVQLAARAVTYLEASPCQYEHAAARVEYGIAARSVAELGRGMDLAKACGAEELVARAREVLETGRGLH